MTTTVVQEIANILGEAHGRPYTEDETMFILTEVAKRIEAERERKSTRTRTRFTPELLQEANRLHNERGLSLNQTAERLGCDRKWLKAKMIKANYEVRGQKESQAARRELELKKGDVISWGAHELFRNGGK